MRDVGYKVRKIRELKNIRQDYIATKLGISQSSYSDLESGKITISEQRLKEIAVILDVDPETINWFSENIVFNSCVQSGNYNVYNIPNTVEKIDDLFNCLLEAQKKQSEVIEMIIKLKETLISALNKT